MRFFLHLRPWPLFTLTFILPFGVMMASSMALILRPLQPTAFILIYSCVMLLLMGSLFGWLWTLGTYLARRLPAGTVAPVRWLHAALVLPGAYILLILGALATVVSTTAPAVQSAWALFIVPLHLLSMAGILYSLQYVARALRSVELQRPAQFSEFVGEFFLLWFYPVGIWFIQPRINRLFAHQPATLGP
ncbi:hypothetical protein [Hymenobacter sp. 102]|uniref:hypothetical protein n=1 Tax=Hymenobacter sp. 102 TaxID=3403152 RepID=UPI003CEC802B